jgi:thiosulfate/3-mercaptopyruvate sulfurtransferase
MARGIARLSKWNGVFSVHFLVIFTLIVSSAPAGVRSACAYDLALLKASELESSRQAWAVLDARPKAEWQAGHIPGAHSFSWDEYTRTDEKGTPYRVWPPEELAGVLSRMGIGENTPIAVYGDADKSWGGEGWACWVLSWLGHKGPVCLLAGGIQSWRARGCPLSTEPAAPQAASIPYRVELRPELDIPTPELEARASSMVLIDTRSTMEWLMGHLPDAVHIPWTEFYAGKDHAPLDADSLKKLLQRHGIDTTRPIVYYCAGGVRSAYAWTVHTIDGLPPAHNYEGGMEDWKRRSPKMAGGKTSP